MLPALLISDSLAWRVEVLVVARAARSSSERSALSRDAARGLLVRVVPGAWVERTAFDVMSPEDRHIVRMRAMRAVTPGPLVFSHFSAAVLHGLPVLRSRLDRLHVTSEDEDDRHRVGVTHHGFALEDEEGVRIGDLTATGAARTVVDVAGAAPFDEGVMAADAAMRAGMPREVLEAAIDLAGPRRAGRRIADTAAFAHPGGESAAESRTRVTAYRIGVEVAQLQRRFQVRGGRSAHADLWFPAADAVLEVDGLGKYLDPALARDGTGRALLDEKYREDDIRAQVRAFGRSGWQQSGSVALLRPVLARLGVPPTRPRTAFGDWADAARAASPRRH